MSHVPEDILTKLLELPPENREKVFRYIQREREVGQTPSREKLEEIIHYLKIKREESKSFSSSYESDDIEFEKSPLEYLLTYNCGNCKFTKNLECTSNSSPLFQQKIHPKLLCTEHKFI
ncbi:MAG: hypothetical protein SFU98_05430 [Leptospiraceae bacterium]|nr:hypothetical protein [Leptospiraceae bacterium]